MPIDTRWYNEQKTIIYTRFSGVWTWDEAILNDEYLRVLLTSVDHGVDIIMDVLDSQPFPPMMPEHVQQILEEPYDNFGLSVVTGGYSFFEQIVATSRKIAGFQFDIDHANTIEQALEMIRQRHHS